MPKVQVLSDTLASQVAAGEVVERPGSVVKELVENSLDASAKRIEVEIKHGGVALIKVEDDGCGMGRDDALLSLERHATSKLRESEDLSTIMTLGFRGEAMPSIASVSRLRMLTREADSVEGLEVNVDGGTLREVREVGCPVGTSIAVQDLFYNVPARRKFLKSESTESAHVDFQVRIHALSHPEVRFVFRKDQRVVFDIPAVTDRRVRIGQLHGQDLSAGLLEVPDFERKEIKVAGYVLPAEMARKGRRQQYVFLNGRPVEDPVLVKAVKEGFRGELVDSAHPVVWLWLEMNPLLVDVNVHPAKREVRFRRPSDVHLAVSEAIAEALRTARRQKREAEQGSVDEAIDAVNEDLGKANATETTPSPPSTAAPAPANPFSPPTAQPAQPNHPTWHHESQPELGQNTGKTMSASATEQTQKEGHPFQILSTLKNRYVMLEGEDGLVFLDPRAAVERITYEGLLAGDGSEQGGIESQGLLVPIVIELDAQDADFVLSNSENFDAAGISVEGFGGNAVQISSLPEVMNPTTKGEGKNARQLVEELIDAMLNAENTASGKKLIYASFAQSVARIVARGEKASSEKADRLLKSLFRCDLPYCAPDGRATLIQVPISELEKKFGN